MLSLAQKQVYFVVNIAPRVFDDLIYNGFQSVDLGFCMVHAMAPVDWWTDIQNAVNRRTPYSRITLSRGYPPLAGVGVYNGFEAVCRNSLHDLSLSRIPIFPKQKF